MMHDTTRKDSYYVLHRREWIREMLLIYGFINRDHLTKKFGISTPQASLDLKAFRQSYPGFVRYNVTRKRYERK